MLYNFPFNIFFCIIASRLKLAEFECEYVYLFQLYLSVNEVCMIVILKCLIMFNLINLKEYLLFILFLINIFLYRYMYKIYVQY